MTVVISSLAECPAEAAGDRETCRRLGTRAGLCLPLSVGGGPPIGALGLNFLRTEREWPDAFVKRLQLVVTVPAEPQIAGALGAALFAFDRAKENQHHDAKESDRAPGRPDAPT